GEHSVTSDAATRIVVRLKVPGGFIASRCIKKIVSSVDPMEEVHVGGIGKRQRIGRRWSERERKKETSVDGLRRAWVREECLSKQVFTHYGIESRGFVVQNPTHGRRKEIAPTAERPHVRRKVGGRSDVHRAWGSAAETPCQTRNPGARTEK